jgi:uncharacterized protein (TIGR02117 family)
MTRNGRTLLRIALAPFALLWALVILYCAAALAGSLIPANMGWQQAETGVRIYVAENGVHTDLILPASAEGVEWGDLIRPADLADPRQAGLSHLVFGWGDRDFYLNTPSWDQVKPGRVFAALAGMGSTVLHVGHLADPGGAARVRAIVLRPDEYRRLAAFVRATFAGGAPVRGYGASDAFYPAKGGYSILNTCNEWTGGALRSAGVRIGRWTPFQASVILWL